MDTTGNPHSRDAVALIVEPDALAAQQIAQTLCDDGLPAHTAGSLAEARRALASHEYGVLLIEAVQTDGSGYDFVEERAGEGTHERLIVVCSNPDAAASIEAMRRGAIDLIAKPIIATELCTRVRSAARQAEVLVQQARRVERLKRICRRLTDERLEAASAHGGAAGETANSAGDTHHRVPDALRALTGSVSALTVAEEFGTLVRSELDVEALLRMTLEFMMARIGHSNAAVFLPTGEDEFTLGAYVNYDVAPESADTVLDHLADVLPQRFREEEEIVRLPDASALAERLGPDANWLADADVTVFASRHNGNCLAVVALFRDRQNPFTDDMLPELQVMRDLFAEQLARVIKVHHRHTPEQSWPGFTVGGPGSDTPFGASPGDPRDDEPSYLPELDDWRESGPDAYDDQPHQHDALREQAEQAFRPFENDAPDDNACEFDPVSPGDDFPDRDHDHHSGGPADDADGFGGTDGVQDVDMDEDDDRLAA